VVIIQLQSEQVEQGNAHNMQKEIMETIQYFQLLHQQVVEEEDHTPQVDLIILETQVDPVVVVQIIIQQELIQVVQEIHHLQIHRKETMVEADNL
tara:strand:- start:419 stop:703 length:285 start_codon:yes stop_codon:yes gene_type:complete